MLINNPSSPHQSNPNQIQLGHARSIGHSSAPVTGIGQPFRATVSQCQLQARPSSGVSLPVDQAKKSSSSQKNASAPKKGEASSSKGKSSSSRSRSKKPTSRRSSSKSKSNNNSGMVRSLPKVQGVKVKSRAPAKEVETRTSPPEPDWIKRIQKDLPPYADEVLAFLLIAIGLLSFFTLLSPSSGALGSAWSGALRRAFGLGSFVISAAIMMAGALLLLPKIGVTIRLNWWRIIAGEFFYVFGLAYLHATIRRASGTAGEIEAFARAIEGRGGGMVGWAIQDIIHLALGDMVTGIILLVLMAFSALLMSGIKRSHVLAALERAQERFIGIATRIEETAPVVPQPTSSTRTTSAATPATAGPARVRSVGASPSPAAQPVASMQAPTTTAPALTIVPQPTVASSSQPDSEGKEVVELEPIPGRPSIVTGERGYVALGMTRTGSKPMRVASPSAGAESPSVEAEEEEELQFEMRFTAGEVRDRKKIRKRSEQMPPLELLDVVEFARPDDEEINRNAALIEKTAQDFGIQVEVVDVKAGPTVTQYAVQPFTEVKGKDGQTTIKRVRVTRVANLGNDFALALAAPSVRIQAPVPGTTYVGIEVPNPRPGIVSLRPVIEAIQFYDVKSPLTLALGREVDGTPFATDLGKMPHLLIGGSTGSGKSVCISSMATCLIANNSPDQLRLVMLDPKMVELVRFNGLPHVMGRVEVQLDRIVGVLRWVTREMERRYKVMEEAMARNIAIYNKGRRRNDRLPYIVVMIDELAELMTEFPDETEHLITRLAQMARATGIHLVVATQRPSTEILTGLIKANFPARISFAVPSGMDSRVIIDSVGAEDLIGRGDMLFQAPDAMAPVRLQGCFTSDAEMERIVEFWRDNYEWEEGVAPWERALTRAAVLEETDEMLEEAIRLVQREGEASASQIQRKLNVGYPRAGRIIDALEEMEVVGDDPGGGQTREVLIDPEMDPTTYIVKWRNGEL